MILVDTNIFLEYLLDQPHSAFCFRTIERIVEEELEAIITSFSLHSIEVIMERKGLHNQLKIFLENPANIPYIMVYHTSLTEEREILDEMEKYKLDFDDAMQFYVARKLKADIITLDSDLQRLSGVNIIEPKTFVEGINKTD